MEGGNAPAGQAEWVFQGAVLSAGSLRRQRDDAISLDERFDQYKRKQRDSEKEKKRIEKEALGYLPFELDHPKKEKPVGRVTLAEEDWFERPAGMSISNVGLGFDLKDAMLKRCALVKAKKRFSWDDPSTLPSVSELERRKNERLAKVRFDAMKIKRIPGAQDWNTGGGRWRDAEPMTCKQLGARSLSLPTKASSTKKKQPVMTLDDKLLLVRNANTRIMMKIEHQR